MSVDERAQWQQIRTRGPLDYVLRIGIGMYGALFAAIVLAARFSVFHTHSQWKVFAAELLQFIIEAVLFGAWAGSGRGISTKSGPERSVKIRSRPDQVLIFCRFGQY